jgi:hypothetical protein
MLNVVLDFDETTTLAPEFWEKFVADVNILGGTVVICTNRVGDDYVDAEAIEFSEKTGAPVVWAALYDDKWSAMEDSGYDPRGWIWIDDMPQYILTSTHEEFIDER